MPLNAEITMESAKISPATIKEDNLTTSHPARVQVNSTIIHQPPRYLNRTIWTIAQLCGIFISFRIFDFSLETSPSQDTQEKSKRSVFVTEIGLNSKRSIDRNRWKLQNKDIGAVLLNKVPVDYVETELEFFQGIESFEVDQDMKEVEKCLNHAIKYLHDHYPTEEK
jgi:hypothetical protein